MHRWFAGVGSAIALCLATVHAQSSTPLSLLERQSPSATSQREIAQLAESFIKSLQNSGDVRKVDAGLIHPVLLQNPPCSIVPFVEADVCRSVRSEDRVDYALAEINTLWLIYEYQLSQATPIFLRSDIARADPLDIFPSEVRELAQRSVGMAKTPEAFKTTYAAIKEIEKRMLDRHSRMTESDRDNFRRNTMLVADAIKQNGAYPDEMTPLNEVLEGAFVYAKAPFVLMVAKDQGVWKVFWFTFGAK